MGFCYCVGTEMKSWTEANITCVGTGGSLALSNIVYDVSTVLSNENIDHWIGMREQVDGSGYVWVNDEIVYLVRGGEGKKPDKDCSYIKKKAILHVEGCNNLRRYICQAPHQIRM